MQPPKLTHIAVIKYKESPEPVTYGPYDSLERAQGVLAVKVKYGPATSIEDTGIFVAEWSQVQ